MSESSGFAQVKIYLGKCFRIFKNEKGWKNLVSTAIIAVIICSVTGDGMFTEYSDTRTGAFALVCACIWVGIFNSIQSICRERGIIKREHRTGLSIPSYITAHLLFEATVCLGEAAIITVVVWVRNLHNLPPMGAFLPFVLELFVDFYLTVLAADLLGMLVSCLVKTETAAMTVMPFVLILQLVLAGMIFELKGLAKAFSNLTVSRWGMAAICVSANVEDMIFLQAKNTDYVYTPGHLLSLWVLLLAFVLVLTVLCVAALSGIDHDQR